MKTSFFKTGALIALLGLSLAACNKPCDEGSHPEGCNDDIVCTADLRSIMITVKDSAGGAVALDEYKTIRLRGNVAFALQEDAATEAQRRHNGIYPVAADNHLRQIQKEGEQVDFYGYKNGKLIVKRTYLVGHDCCHILEKDNNSQTVVVAMPN